MVYLQQFIMTNLKLICEEEEEEEAIWIAIHATLPNYRMAYYLNQSLCTKFKIIVDEDKIIKKEPNHYFTHFEYLDNRKQKIWKLLQNKSFNIGATNQKIGLFETENFSSTLFLVPEVKIIDFILKIDGSSNTEETKEIIRNINGILNVNKAYELPKKIIKSKNNLLYKA